VLIQEVRMSDNLNVKTPTKGHNKSEWGQTIRRKSKDYSLLCNVRVEEGRSSNRALSPDSIYG